MGVIPGKMNITRSLRYLRNCAGNSREQAAISLKYRGLALVVAGSLSETYKRQCAEQRVPHHRSA